MENENKKSVFEKLYAVDVSKKIGKKMGLSYLSWADAWAELKKLYPNADYKIYTRNVETRITKVTKLDENTTVTKEESYFTEVPYFTDGRTCWVKVGVKIGCEEQIETYPIMNNKNGSIYADAVTSTDVNKATQRAFVKACARHGLGLYIYAGEDLPEDKRVDMAVLVKEVEKAKIAPLTQENFSAALNKVIDYIKSEADHLDGVFTQYVQSLFPNRRLSTLTFEDESGVRKLNYLVSKIVD